MNNLDLLKFDEKGLIPVITQDYKTKAVLMLAYATKDTLKKTLETGLMHYFSRSRNEVWLKGETSGHYQHLIKIAYDCDSDGLLALVKQDGVACHTGNLSCFYRELQSGKEIVSDKGDLDELYDVIIDRRDNPQEGSYTNYLFNKGIDKMLKKVGEESAEVIIAAKNKDKCELTLEISDLMYHLSVVMAESGLVWNDIYEELKNRR